MPHSFVRLPNGNVLASFQYPDHGSHHGSAAAMSGKSGGLVEIDENGKAVRSVSNADPAYPNEGLLPYSLAVLPKIDRVIVTNSPMGDDYLLTSNTYQLFRLSDLKLLGTHRFDPGPKLSGHVSPEEPRIGPDGAAYVQTLSCGIQRVAGLDGSGPTARLVHSSREVGAASPRSSTISWFKAYLQSTGSSFSILRTGDRPVEVSRLTISDKYDPPLDGLGPGFAPPGRNLGTGRRPHVFAQARHGDRRIEHRQGIPRY